MIFDYLRAGYTAPARWLSIGSATITVRWYRAAKGAKVYTLPHAFGSSVWDVPGEVADNGPGEIHVNLGWSGSPPNPPAGLSTPTPADWFLHGVPPEAVANLPSCTAHVSVSACGCGGALVSVRKA